MTLFAALTAASAFGMGAHPDPTRSVRVAVADVSPG